MRTVSRLLYRDIVASVGFVALAFLSLFFFIDFVDDLDQVGRRGRTVWHVALGAAYELPGHLYELLPIAVLIGTIYALARMAQASEFTILRTGGLGPGRALGLLAVLGVAFGALNFVLGDYVAPASERAAVLLEARFNGGVRVGRAGAWLKERAAPTASARSRSTLPARAPTACCEGVRIFEFDAEGNLLQRVVAPRPAQARVADDGTWTLSQADTTRWPRPGSDGPVHTALEPTLTWPSTLSARRGGRGRAAAGDHDDAGAVALQRSPQRPGAGLRSSTSIRFWKKALYPLACLVMVALALPFAYLHARAGSVSLKVFGGIMLGISFVLLNNLAGHMGLLRELDALGGRGHPQPGYLGFRWPPLPGWCATVERNWMPR
jgi:lipopolysaccharide export system permease protein